VTRKPPPPNLKILIVSTPKTGNTWLQHLLATAYNLPVVDFVRHGFWEEVERQRINGSNSSWIGKYHLRPQEDSFDWAREFNVVLITTVRHPADTLVSLYHYVQNFADRVQIDAEAVRFLLVPAAERNNSDKIPLSEGLETYVRSKFFHSLNYSIGWLHSGLSYGLRYEDLWHSPVTTLKALTDQIYQISEAVVEDAVEQCRIDTLRQTAGDSKAFFRAGGVGGWKSSLPPAIVQLFRAHRPYPLQFKWLSYDVDSVANQNDGQVTYREPMSPLAFSNGVPIDPLIARIFSSLDAQRRNRWASCLGATGENDNFYSWLNGSAEDDPHAGRVAPVVTNLGAYLYRGRPDLQKAFPDLYGRDRAGFGHWFVVYVPIEYPELDTTFVARVCESWVQGPAPTFSPVHLPKEQTFFSLTPKKCHPAEC
jgi:hypothetical protein